MNLLEIALFKNLILRRYRLRMIIFYSYLFLSMILIQFFFLLVCIGAIYFSVNQQNLSEIFNYFISFVRANLFSLPSMMISFGFSAYVYSSVIKPWELKQKELSALKRMVNTEAGLDNLSDYPELKKYFVV
jgi:hypothetical protein